MAHASKTQIEIDVDVYKILEGNRKDFNENHNQILRRIFNLPTQNDRPAPIILQEEKKERASGGFSFQLFGIDYNHTSMKSAYKQIAEILSDYNQNFLEDLSREETSARRIVAKNKTDLYKKTPQLAEKFAEKIKGDWWIDINLSSQQVGSRIVTFCKIARIKFGEDLIVDF